MSKKASNTSERCDLGWGQTPWDAMDREALLREVWRMYLALQAMNNLLAQFQWGQEASPFWGPGGTGGKAAEMMRQILEPLHQRASSQAMYDNFFRYAGDLLFDGSTGYRTGHGWVACPECGAMYAGDYMAPPVGERCDSRPMGQPGCQGVFRQLQWEDFGRQVEAEPPGGEYDACAIQPLEGLRLPHSVARLADHERGSQATPA